MAVTPRSLEDLKLLVRDFALSRDWDQFHSPKNLSMALTAEAGELLEVFQWVGDSESRSPSSEVLNAARSEMADVLIYLVRLADKLDVDLLQAAAEKVSANEIRYPAHEVRGSAKKR